MEIVALGPAAAVKTVASPSNWNFQSFLKIAASHNLELSVAQETQGGHEKILSEQGGHMAVTPNTLLRSPVHLAVPLGQQLTVPCDSFLPGVQ